MLNEKDEKYLIGLIKTAKRKCQEKYNIEIKAEIKIDKNKTLAENKTAIIEKIKTERDLQLKQKKNNNSVRKDQEIKTKELDEMKAKAREEEKKTQKIAEKINKSIICKNKDITKHYHQLRRSVEMTAKGYLNSCFIQGRAGTGKSYQNNSILNELGFMLNNGKNTTAKGDIDIERNKKRYVVFSGDMSLAYLYRFLYEHNGKVIVFRDLVKLINSIRTIDILKAVTETHGKRIVQKALYSKEQEDLPRSFICESRFVFEMNSLDLNDKKLKDDIEALLTRGDYRVVVFSFDEMADIMRQIAKKEHEKEVTDFLIANYKFVGWNNLNLRTQNKALKIYQYAIDHKKDWKVELKDFLKSETSAIRKQLYTYIGERAVRSLDLKRLLVQTHIEGCWTLRTADRRIREWVMMRELFIVGFVTNEDDELENYLNSHRNHYLSLKPIENIEISDTSDKVTEQIKGQKKVVESAG